MQVRTRASAAGPLKRPASEVGEQLERVSGLSDRNKRPANELLETTSTSRLPDRNRWPPVSSSLRAREHSFVSPITPSVALGSHSGKPNPPSTTSRPQAGQADAPNPPLATSGSGLQTGPPDAPSVTLRQPGTSYPASATPGPDAGSLSALPKVWVFLEIQRPTGPPKKCWSILVEEMDIFTGQRVRSQLLKFKQLRDSEKVLMVHVRQDDGSMSFQCPGVETTFIMLGDRPKQRDWEAMLKGLRTYYSTYPEALDLNLRATLEVEDKEV
jgi:hypothetical protein